MRELTNPAGRGRVEAVARGNGGALLVAFALSLATTSAVGVVASSYLAPTTLGQARQGLAALATALFVSAALAYLLRWRLTGEAPVALVGVALLVYGSVVGLLGPFGVTLVGQRPGPAASSGLLRALVSAVVIFLLIRSLSTPQVDASLHPLRVFVLAVTGLVAALVTVATGMRLTDVASPAGFVDSGLHGAVAVGWAAAAVMLVRRGASRLQGDVLWIGLALGCLCLANAVRAASTGHSAAGLAVAAGISALAGGVALFGTSLHLTQILSSHGSERMRLTAEAVANEALQSTQRARREERLHDVRSALAAIRCAAGTLQRYDVRLEAQQRHSLQTAVSSELGRLEALIDPPPPDQLQTFRLHDELAAIVATEQALGSDLTVLLRETTANARPFDVTRIVQNLLVNARVHGLGTPVRLSASQRDGVVSIAVADGGPGVPAAERELIFERGRRGGAAEGDGSGLGLFVSRELAREQGGDLLVHDRVGGGAVFQLRLPAASPHELAQQRANAAEATRRVPRRKR
jgi:signal transduction histidine kinase